MLSIRLPAKLDSLHSLQNQVRDYLIQQQLGAPEILQVELVCEELMVNSVNHGGAKELGLVLQLTDQELCMKWIDDGVFFDPNQPRDGTPEIGGKGLILIRDFFSSIEYMRESDRNYWILSQGRS